MVKTIFVPAEWKGEIKLTEDVVALLAGKKVALFASVQFLALKNVEEQLTKVGCRVLTTKAKRADKSIQLLGCDAYIDAFMDNIISEADAILYVGDGLFHPKALLIAQMYSDEIKDVIAYNPITMQHKMMGEKDIADIVRKKKANLNKFMLAKKIGILVTLKQGQSFLPLAEKLKRKLENEGKRCYIFIADHLDLLELENFNFIECWVNTACPRIGFDDAVNAAKPIINAKEAMDTIKFLERL